MDSNEHGVMEQNEEHLEANISIYYTHETELYAESYDAMNRCIYCKNIRTEYSGEGGGKGRPAGGRRGARRGSGSGAGRAAARGTASGAANGAGRVGGGALAGGRRAEPRRG